MESGDFRKRPISTEKLWEALGKTLDVFGPALKEATILELEKNGFDFGRDGSTRSYTLDELGQKLSIIFGQDGTEVILDQLAKKLARSESR
ncbi:MAG TPA: hypothetical protein VLA68_02975 [Nitrososphaera sp.]|nr:hypothetical protein [Nitrososphaera sp.]